MENLTDREKEYLLDLIKKDEAQLTGIKGTSFHTEVTGMIESIKRKLELAK